MLKHQTLEPIDSSITDVTNYPFVGQHHGTTGPVRTSFNDSAMPLESAAIQALDEAAGFSKKPIDPWSGDHIGFYNTLGAVSRSGPNKGKRSYAARGYFEANASRSNLKVLCEATVEKITLEENTATGVDFSFAGESHSVKASKEVIICGGVIHSPQILELSGIGDPSVLNAAGVECKVELPAVGENLQDHLLTAVGYELKPEMYSGDILYNPEVMEAAQKQYVETQGGPLSSIACVQGFFPYKGQATSEELEKTIKSIRHTQAQSTTSSFYKRQLDQVITHLENERSGNLSLYMIPVTTNFETGVQTQRIFSAVEPGLPHRFTLASGIQYPASRGSIHITSSGMFVPPFDTYS